MGRFFQYILRTTDVSKARAFYAAVLGSDGAEIDALPEVARARGARPHWLGIVEAGDVGACFEGFQARGAVQLGPKQVLSGTEAIVMRDPGGAVVGLGTPAPGRGRGFPDVASHVLNASDVERAKRTYHELLGWQLGATRELAAFGVAHEFAFAPDEAPSGAMLDIAGRSAVHAHWLFHFRVTSLEAALAAVTQHGGVYLPTQSLPNGAQVAVCDDSQGAAFGLYQAS